MKFEYAQPFSFKIGHRPEPVVSRIRHGVTEITLSDGRLAYTWKFPYAEEQILPEMTAYRVQHVCTVVITSSADNAIQSYKMDDC